MWGCWRKWTFLCAFAIQRGHGDRGRCGGEGQGFAFCGHRQHRYKISKAISSHSPKLLWTKSRFACIRNYNQIFHFHQRPTGECVVRIFNSSGRRKLEKKTIYNRCVDTGSGRKLPPLTLNGVPKYFDLSFTDRRLHVRRSNISRIAKSRFRFHFLRQCRCA